MMSTTVLIQTLLPDILADETPVTVDVYVAGAVHQRESFSSDDLLQDPNELINFLISLVWDDQPGEDTDTVSPLIMIELKYEQRIVPMHTSADRIAVRDDQIVIDSRVRTSLNQVTFASGSLKPIINGEIIAELRDKSESELITSRL